MTNLYWNFPSPKGKKKGKMVFLGESVDFENFMALKLIYPNKKLFLTDEQGHIVQVRYKDLIWEGVNEL